MENEVANWSDGETPPPSASPIHGEKNNVNNNNNCIVVSVLTFFSW